MLLALALAIACGPSSEEKAEAGGLCRAIDVLRNAPNAAKSELLATLAALPCARPALCELKQSCLAAYRLHVHGLAQEAQAKSELASGAAADTIGSLLDGARDELERARPLVASCVDQQSAVKRRYKLQ
jgi:hypothetical protein